MGEHKRKAAVPNPPRLCIFCGTRGVLKPGMSKEHAFSNWIRKNYLPDSSVNHVVTSSDDSWMGPEYAKEPDRTISGASGSRTFKIVCEDCNTGWMHQMEDQVMALLGTGFTGGSLSLDVDQQSLIARWVEKTSMVRELGDADDPVSSQEQRTALMTSKGADPFTQVWMGTFHNPAGPLRNRHHTFGSAAGGIDIRQDSMVIGPYVFQLMSSADEERSKHHTMIIDNNCVGDFLKQIWPIKHDIVDWPTKAMNYRQYYFMAETVRWEIGVQAKFGLNHGVVLFTPEDWCTVKPTEILRVIPGVGPV